MDFLLSQHLCSYTLTPLASQAAQGGLYHFPGAGLWSSSSWTNTSPSQSELLGVCMWLKPGQWNLLDFSWNNQEQTFSEGLFAVTKMYPLDISGHNIGKLAGEGNEHKAKQNQGLEQIIIVQLVQILDQGFLKEKFLNFPVIYTSKLLWVY